MGYCKAIKLPGGGTAIAHFSGRRPAPCSVCGKREHTKLCDALVNGKVRTTTCDRKLCGQCSTPGPQKTDFCPEHKHLA